MAKNIGSYQQQSATLIFKHFFMILCPYHSPQKYWEPVLIARWMGKGEINCKRTIGLKIIQIVNYLNVAASERSLLKLMLFLEKGFGKGS
jgi:hypothetical protein